MYYATKALKMPRVSERDKFIFSIYKAEAQYQISPYRNALATIKEVPSKQELSLKCSFGYPSPWVDRNIDYPAKLIQQVNYYNIATNDEQEAQTPEYKAIWKDIVESAELNKYKEGITPLSSVILFTSLKSGSLW